MNKLNLKLAKRLLAAGCNINHTDYQSYETPAFKAIVNNFYDLVKFYVIEGTLKICLFNFYHISIVYKHNLTIFQIFLIK